MYYRFSTSLIESYDPIQFEFSLGSVFLHSFVPVKETKCGIWILNNDSTRRFVNNNTKKRYCYPTKDEAYEAFILRKKKQIKILETQLNISLEILIDFSRLDKSDVFESKGKSFTGDIGPVSLEKTQGYLEFLDLFRGLKPPIVEGIM